MATRSGCFCWTALLVFCTCALFCLYMFGYEQEQIERRSRFHDRHEEFMRSIRNAAKAIKDREAFETLTNEEIAILEEYNKITLLTNDGRVKLPDAEVQAKCDALIQRARTCKILETTQQPSFPGHKERIVVMDELIAEIQATKRQQAEMVVLKPQESSQQITTGKDEPKASPPTSTNLLSKNHEK